MAIINPVYSTALFKNVAPFIASLHPLQLAIELMKVMDKGQDVKWDAKDIDDAFMWEESPQGMAFWDKLHGEFRKQIVHHDLDEL
jgi:hypothetical protein